MSDCVILLKLKKNPKEPHNFDMKRERTFNPYKPSVQANSADPDQTPQNATSDQDVHCLLTNCSIKIRIKMENTTQHPLKRNGLVQLISKRNSIRLKCKWVKLFNIFSSIQRRTFEPAPEISNNVVYATSKASDQPAHTRSLIQAFASRLNIV